jgi:hypothetical protein
MVKNDDKTHDVYWFQTKSLGLVQQLGIKSIKIPWLIIAFPLKKNIFLDIPIFCVGKALVKLPCSGVHHPFSRESQFEQSSILPFSHAKTMGSIGKP